MRAGDAQVSLQGRCEAGIKRKRAKQARIIEGELLMYQANHQRSAIFHPSIGQFDAKSPWARALLWAST